MKPRIGIIGAGVMGMNHVRVLRELGCDVVASDISQDSLKRAQAMGAEVFQDYKEVKDVDAVTIASPTTLHFQIASHFLENQIPTLVEKPITENVRDAEKLVALTKSSGTMLMVGHIERFNPMVKKVKEIIDSGYLGEIYHCSAYRLNPSGRANDSAVLDLSTHDIDVLRYITGREIDSIYAEAVYKDGIEKHVSAILNFGGLKAVVKSSLLYPIKKRGLVILGSEGLIEGNYITQDINLFRSVGVHDTLKDFEKLGTVESQIFKPLVRKQEPLKLEMEHFLECIKHGNEPLTNGEEGMKTLAAALKVQEKCKQFQ